MISKDTMYRLSSTTLADRCCEYYEDIDVDVEYSMCPALDIGICPKELGLSNSCDDVTPATWFSLLKKVSME